MHRLSGDLPLVVQLSRFQDRFGTHDCRLGVFARHPLGQVDNPVRAIRDVGEDRPDELAGPPEPSGPDLALDQHQLELQLAVQRGGLRMLLHGPQCLRRRSVVGTRIGTRHHWFSRLDWSGGR